MQLVALTLALGAAAAAAQAPPAPAPEPTPEPFVRGLPPAALAGQWVGAFQVRFALANASDANSWACLPAGAAPISVPHSMTFSGDGTVADGSWPDVRVSAGGASFLWPGSTSFAFYDLIGLNASSSILSLAYQGDPDPLWDAVCHFAAISGGAGSNGRLLITTIGGAAFSWDDQCSTAGYSTPENGGNPAVPFCRPLSATSNEALATSVVGTYARAAPSTTPTKTGSAFASESPYLSTPSAPPRGISLPSATAGAAPLGSAGGGDGDGSGSGSGSSGGGGGSPGSGGESGDDSGSGGGRGADDGSPASPSPPASSFGVKGSSGAQGVASLASVAVAAFLGAALAAAFQHA